MSVPVAVVDFRTWPGANHLIDPEANEQRRMEQQDEDVGLDMLYRFICIMDSADPFRSNATWLFLGAYVQVGSRAIHDGLLDVQIFLDYRVTLGFDSTGGLDLACPIIRLSSQYGIQREERANWMYDHTVCQFQHLSTHDNLDPHLQIDPFPGRKADYPPFGYHGPMPPGYAYRPYPSHDSSS
ncbi:hypothetical protein Tco_0150847 [Tanacetum coccineum]